MVTLDIEGLKKHKVQDKNKSMLQMKSRDRRKWKKDSRANWRGFKTVRYRNCAGEYSCPNVLCSYFKDFGKLNELNFDRENRCEFCSAAGIQIQICCLYRK